MLVYSQWTQCGGNRPTWAKSTYHKTLDNSYLEVVVESGNSRDNTRLKAEEEINRRRKETVGEDRIKIKSKAVAEWWETCENGNFKGYFLYQTLKNPSYKLEDIEITDKYPFSARAFVPGMFQIYKGSMSKGVCFIAGEAIMIGGIVTSYSLRANNIVKANSTHNTTLRKYYTDNANMFQTIGVVCIAGASVLYVWNIIDGTVAKGKSHIQVGKADISFIPTVQPSYLGMNCGVGMYVKF